MLNTSMEILLASIMLKAIVVSGLKDNGLQVHTLSPILVKAVDFGLIEGIEKLRTVAKLSSIDTTIPVTFTLVFQKQ